MDCDLILSNTENKNEETITLKVYRENRGKKQDRIMTLLKVPYKRWTTVLDALLYAKSYIDPVLPSDILAGWHHVVRVG